MENMIEVRSVNKTFGKKGGVKTQVLNGAELEVKRGEFVSLMGASGSGKSTLLYLMGGLDTNYEGNIYIAGQKMTGMKEAEILLADEPTGNLDSKSTVEIMNLFKKINEEKGITFLQVTHSPETAEYGDRIIRLDSGKLVG